MTANMATRLITFGLTAEAHSALSERLRSSFHIDAVRAYPALTELGERAFEEMREMEPHVALIACDALTERLKASARALRERCPMELIALTKAREEARDTPFCASISLCEGMNEDFVMKLVYQIRNARLAGYVRSLGLKGKWVNLPAAPKRENAREIRVIGIGASAGGTEAVTRLVTRFPADFPCVLVVQHMPPVFTKRFADGLNAKSEPLVKEAEDGDALLPGRVYIAPGDRQMTVVNQNGLKLRVTQDEKVSGHRPSVDALFLSLAKAAGAQAVGVILTGMGRDGARGLLAMREAGAYTIGQDEASSAVYGMPAAAMELGAVTRQLALDQIPLALFRACGGGVPHERR